MTIEVRDAPRFGSEFRSCCGKDSVVVWQPARNDMNACRVSPEQLDRFRIILICLSGLSAVGFGTQNTSDGVTEAKTQNIPPSRSRAGAINATTKPIIFFRRPHLI